MTRLVRNGQNILQVLPRTLRRPHELPSQRLPTNDTLSNTVILATAPSANIMKLLTIVSIASLLTCQAAMASVPEFRFAATVQADNSPVERFSQPVQGGHVRILDLPAGLKVEMAAPSQDGESAETYVRLLQRDGDTYRVLHEARRTGPSSAERSFSYVVCGTNVQFISPAPAVVPECKR